MNRFQQLRRGVEEAIRRCRSFRQGWCIDGDIVNQLLDGLTRYWGKGKPAKRGAALGWMKHDLSCIGIWIICIRCRRHPVTTRSTRRSLTNHIRFRACFDAVFNAIEEPAKPLVHQLKRRIASVATLMEVLNQRHLPLNGIADTYTMLWNDIPIIECMCHHDGALDPTRKLQQITLRPESIVITSKPVLILRKETIAVQLVVLRTVGGISTVDEIIKRVDVFAQPPSRVPNQPI